MKDFCVTVSTKEAIRIIKNDIVNGSITGTLIDEYNNDFTTVLVFDKQYNRSGRVILTVVIDTYFGKTHIHTFGTGGGLLRFNWGASESFERCVSNALSMYMITSNNN